MATAIVISTPRTIGNAPIGKVIQALICLAALGVLAENVLLVGQNRDLEEAIAPQIVSGAHLDMIGGLTGNCSPLQRKVTFARHHILETVLAPGVDQGRGGDIGLRGRLQLHFDAGPPPVLRR